jgi:hypothetical protein
MTSVTAAPSAGAGAGLGLIGVMIIDTAVAAIITATATAIDFFILFCFLDETHHHKATKNKKGKNTERQKRLQPCHLPPKDIHSG